MTASPRLPWALLIACLALTACGDKPAASSASKPSTTAAVGHETELLKVTLTPAAETRLGLKTTAVGRGSAQPVRTVHGEVIVPPFAGGVPTTSTTDLATLGSNGFGATTPQFDANRILGTPAPTTVGEALDRAALAILGEPLQATSRAAILSASGQTSAAAWRSTSNARAVFAYILQTPQNQMR